MQFSKIILVLIVLITIQNPILKKKKNLIFLNKKGSTQVKSDSRGTLTSRVPLWLEHRWSRAEGQQLSKRPNFSFQHFQLLYFNYSSLPNVALLPIRSGRWWFWLIETLAGILPSFFFFFPLFLVGRVSNLRREDLTETRNFC